MKLLAARSLLSSPYTWMTPPGRAPSPDVGEVLLAEERGVGGAKPAHWAGQPSSRRGMGWGLPGAHSQAKGKAISAPGRPGWGPPESRRRALWTHLSAPGAGLGAGPRLERVRAKQGRERDQWSQRSQRGRLRPARDPDVRPPSPQAPGVLTLGQGDGDDDSVAGAHPEAVARDKQGCDAHEGEA